MHLVDEGVQDSFMPESRAREPVLSTVKIWPPPAGLEPTHLAPEASALSPELRGLTFRMLSASLVPEQAGLRPDSKVSAGGVDIRVRGEYH